jgi:hypothetical protein
VNDAVDSGGMQYAVIAGLRTETGPERLVIAYPNEESLRDLLAAPSIIAAGFSSREEAAASRETERQRREPGFAESGFAELPGDRSVFRKLARFIASSYGDIAATVIIIFSSKSVVSAVLRMALGSSV